MSQPALDLRLRSSPLDSRSLELLHHYTSVACFSFAEPRNIHVCQVDIPQMALRYEFIMYGILAVAALHLSTLQTARKTELLQAAMRLENVAIPSFRRLLSSKKSENIHAVFAFAGFVVPYMLAMSGSHDSSNCIPSLDNKHPHWFHSLRGLIMLLVRTQDDLAQGPLSPLLTKCAPTDYGRNPEDIHFVRIQKLLQSTKLSSGSDEKDLAACMGALHGLSKLDA